MLECHRKIADEIDVSPPTVLSRVQKLEKDKIIKSYHAVMQHVFGAKPKKLGGVRSLIFNTGKLQRLGKVYDLSARVQIINGESSSKESGSDGADVTVIDTDNDNTTSSEGLDSYTKREEIEHEIQPNEDSARSPYPSNVFNPTQANDSKNVLGSDRYR